jgi:hypothetical protein
MNVTKLANASYTHAHNTLKTLGKHSRNTLVAWGHLEIVRNTKRVGVYL